MFLVLLDVWVVLLYLVRVVEVQAVVKSIPTVEMVEPMVVTLQAVAAQAEIVLAVMPPPQ